MKEILKEILEDKTLNEVANLLETTVEDMLNEEFENKPFYNSVGDCIEYRSTPEDYHAKRIDSLLTLFISAELGKAIGYKLKGINSVLEVLKENRAFSWEEDGVSLDVVFLKAIKTFKDPEDDKLPDYIEAMKLSKDLKLAMN